MGGYREHAAGVSPASEVPAPPVFAAPVAFTEPLPIFRAQSWEDPELLRALLPVSDPVLVAEASGDDALTLLALGAREVVVTVPNAASAALVELKRAAARELPIQSVRSLLGLGHFGRRLWFYHYVRPRLPAGATAVLDAHEAAIREGLAVGGAVERAMAGFRGRLLPLLGAPSTPRPGFRWRAAVALAAPALARLASAPSDGSRALPGPMPGFDAAAAARLTRALAIPSFFRDWLLDGAWRDLESAHPWLTTGGLASLRSRTAGLEVLVAGRRDALPSRLWGAVVLGRSAPSPDELELLARQLATGGRVLGWSIDKPPVLPRPLRLDAAFGARLAELDRGLFPGRPWVAARA